MPGLDSMPGNAMPIFGLYPSAGSGLLLQNCKESPVQVRKPSPGASFLEQTLLNTTETLENARIIRRRVMAAGIHIKVKRHQLSRLAACTVHTHTEVVR